MEFVCRARRSKLERWQKTMISACWNKALYVLSNSLYWVVGILLWQECLYMLEMFVLLFLFFTFTYIQLRSNWKKSISEARLRSCFTLWSGVLNAGYNNTPGTGYQCGA